MKRTGVREAMQRLGRPMAGSLLDSVLGGSWCGLLARPVPPLRLSRTRV